MNRPVFANNTEAAKLIWECVGRAAKQTPDWVKQQVQMASLETIRNINENKSEAVLAIRVEYRE